MQQRTNADLKQLFIVSVPSTGRSGLQHTLTVLVMWLMRSFSTLYGSKWVATRLLRIERATVQVSVPCTGRSGLQPLLAYSHIKRFFGFQYPLRVEMGCNNVCRMARAWQVVVSVPSTGRSGLQHFAISRLYWNLQKFQYPLRVEVGCNSKEPVPKYLPQKFQYPLRVEVGCNLRSVNGVRGGFKVSVPSTGRSGLQQAHPQV